MPHLRSTSALTFVSMISLSFISTSTRAVTLEWTRKIGNTYAYGGIVSADSAGNVYITGTIDINFGDAILAKYDAAGNLQWTRQLGTSTEEESRGVSVDGLGNVYISGVTRGSLGGPNAGFPDAFVAKYDAAGNHLWSRQLGTSDVDFGERVSADSLGNVYISGATSGSLGGTNAGSRDAFVSRYDADGNLQWTRQLRTSGEDYGFGISTDGLGNVYLSGRTYGSLGGPNAGDSDAFLAKFDVAGNQTWVRQLGTSGYDGSSDIVSDGTGNTYITGTTWGSLGGPAAGGGDAFLAKYDVAGNQKWVRQLGSSTIDEGYSVSTDGLGNVFISGFTYGSLGGPNTGNRDAFVAKYDVFGELLWTRQIGTSAYDESHGVSTDGHGNIFIGGVTGGNLGGTNASGSAAFLAKYSDAPGPPGDFNSDGNVDAADYAAWRKSNGSSADYNTWRASFGATAAGAAAIARLPIESVPEPTTLVLAGFVILSLSRKPRRFT